jgi:hypothetical protein
MQALAEKLVFALRQPEFQATRRLENSVCKKTVLPDQRQISL